MLRGELHGVDELAAGRDAADVVTGPIGRIRDALGIESDDVANYVFPQTWPANREQRARIIGEWLKAEARFLASPSVVPE